jgi:hypothetical protein
MLTQIRSLSHRRRIMEAASWTPFLPTAGGYYPEHWYRSDQGLWQDAGVTPAASDGDVVGRWEDLANADHVNQANAANKPTLQNGAGDLLNGHAVVRADGINDFLAGAFTVGGVLTQPFTYFAVAKSTVAAGAQRDLWDSTTAARVVLFQSGGTWYLYAGAAIASVPADTNWNIWTALYNGAGGQFWANGMSKAVGNVGANNPGGLTMFARQGGGGEQWVGDMAEFIIYENLSNGDKNQVGQYLAARYALAYTNIV